MCALPDLRYCVAEIIRIDRDIKVRMDRGSSGNLGKSLVGCFLECTKKHFPTDTAARCTKTKTSFAQAARTSPALLKTDFAAYIAKQCGNDL
jgi:hypothetical protein